MRDGQVYRFGELISVNVPREDGNSYISAGEARKLARALYMAARSVEQEHFSDSECSTIVEFERVDRYRKVKVPATQKPRRN